MKQKRNDICACGSGKKYKKCCELNEERISMRRRPMLFTRGSQYGFYKDAMRTNGIGRADIAEIANRREPNA